MNPGKWTRQLLKKKTKPKKDSTSLLSSVPFFYFVSAKNYSTLCQIQIYGHSIAIKVAIRRDRAQLRKILASKLGVRKKRHTHTEPEKPQDLLNKYKIFDFQGALLVVKLITSRTGSITSVEIIYTYIIYYI